MVQLQESISKHLHHHTLSNMLSNGIFEAHYAQILSCFGLGADVWFTARLVFPTFQSCSPVFSTTLHMWLGLPHLSIMGIRGCVCTHPINPMGIHFLHCAHGNECIGTHDVICNTFATIAWDASFHVGQKQLHVFPSITFNSSHQQVNIMFTKNGICTLVDVIIIDLTCIDLLPQSCAIQGFVTSDVTQAKERSYHNRHPTINSSP
jgi:hypothetical protein